MFYLNNLKLGVYYNNHLFEKNLYKNVLSEDGEKEIQKIKYNKEKLDQHSCCISFEDFEEGQEIYKLPCGSHIF